MNRFLLTAVLAAACALPCAAQTKEIVEEVGVKLDGLRIAARHADERAEDVEILRRLLNKSLGLADTSHVLIQPPGSWVTSTDAAWREIPANHAEEVKSYLSQVRPLEFKKSGLVVSGGQPLSQAVGPFDGVYLKGAGVVYTLRIPAGMDLTYDPHTQRVGLNTGCNKCHQDIAPNTNTHFISFSHSNFHGECKTCHTVGEVRPGVQPVSEWEQAKRQLRGDQPNPPEPKKEGKPRGVLCDPGELAEQITAQLFAHARNVRHLGEKEAITVVVTFDDLPGPKPAAASPAKLGLTPDEVQALTLGDLHMKQKKYNEAVTEYLKGLVRFKDTVRLSAPANTPYKDVTAALEEMTGSIRATYKSLAAAYLALGHLEDAKQALEKATAVRVELSTGSTGDTAKAVGPAKLILSVVKADLATKDAAAFKKAVTVERINFPPAEPKQAK